MALKQARGSIMLFVIVFGSIGLALVLLSVVSYAVSENAAANSKLNREEALQIAEAGIGYYRWHLAHNNTDFWDGNPSSTPGPYIHEYKDRDDNVIGHYSLAITPPLPGSSVVTIQSTGWLDSQPRAKRTIKVRVGFPSLTDYAFLTNSAAWIGDAEVMHGKFHSNSGIRFDGAGDAIISSAVATYTCQSFHGCSGNPPKPGIWGDGGPSSYWKFPVPAKDFTVVTAQLANIKSIAQSGTGIYLSPSGNQGWRIKFNPGNVGFGTITIYKVLTVNCYTGKDINDNTNQNFCIDIKTTGPGTTYPIPTSTFIFADDTVWVDGIVNGRATIGTGVGKNIIINGNIQYMAKDGSNALGLIAEQNILIPHDSPDVLEIDAALLAQNGGAKRYFFPNSTKSSLTIFGSVITNGMWTWNWVNGGGQVVSGYESTTATYDTNLTYGPPSGFPIGSGYNLISWEEVK